MLFVTMGSSRMFAIIYAPAKIYSADCDLHVAPLLIANFTISPLSRQRLAWLSSEIRRYDISRKRRLMIAEFQVVAEVETSTL